MLHLKKPFYEHRGALRGTPGSVYPQPGPNATELPSSAPGRPKLTELQASAPSPTPTRAEEHIAATPNFRPRAPAPSPTPTRAEHLAELRLRALARRRAPKRTSHYTWLIVLQDSAPSPTPTRAEEHIATTPNCKPHAPAPLPTPTRAEHLAGLRLRALARRRAPKRTSHYTCRCERVALHVKRYPGSSHDVKTCGLLLLQYGRWRALAKGAGWTVLNSQRSHYMQTKTAHHDPWHRRCLAPQVALTRPRLLRFALHFAILSLNIKLTLP